MKSSVSLKEMVGTKTIYALLLVCYYWMWARRDWHHYYDTIQNMIATFSILFFVMQAVRIRKYAKEEKDERAIQILHRVDALGLKIMVASVIVIAFASAVAIMDGRMMGYALVGTIFALTVIRFILFCVMTGKEV
ncbi:MAG: hypothetical protein K2O93_00075 [Oscillospiraceae bacterium]|nr:hypothetical protein [Oscillospiraceae bacterium]